MKHLRFPLLALLMALTAIVLPSCGSDDGDNNKSLTQAQADSYLRQVWTCKAGSTTYTLSLAKHNQAFVKKQGTAQPLAQQGATYALTPIAGDYSQGTIQISDEASTTIHYRNLTQNTMEVSINGTNWAKASVFNPSTELPTQPQTLAFLLSGDWKAKERIQPLPEGAVEPIVNQEVSFYIGEDATLNFTVKENLNYKVEDETLHSNLEWHFINGSLHPNPDDPENAYKSALLKFGQYSNQFVYITNLSPAGADISGLSYGSNFLPAKLGRTVN